MLHSYVLHYPMTPYGGVFIATVGVCVIAGAVLQNYRDNLVWIGFALGTVLSLAVGGILSRGLHSQSLAGQFPGARDLVGNCRIPLPDARCSTAR
jgi:drug/metabolite transporter (DMT)-like permease